MDPVIEVCARLAGRLPDDVLRSVREDYFGGEPALAEATLLLTLAYENIGITLRERDLIRSTLDDPSCSDLAAVPIIDEVPPVRYRFTALAPVNVHVNAPEKADALLSAEAARYGGRLLRRAWRTPLDGTSDRAFDGASDGATWVYVLEVAEGANVLGAFSGLSGRLWVELREKWPLEVVGGGPLSPYQAALVAVAAPVWSA